MNVIVLERYRGRTLDFFSCSGKITYNKDNSVYCTCLDTGL